MNRPFIFAMLLACAIALLLRCPQLDIRPMHNDEAVNAIKLRQLLGHGGYRYDPSEYHGPTLEYLSRAWMKLTGVADFNDVTESRLRQLTVAFGLALLLLVPLISDGLGLRAAICAAFLTAISPAMVFYSRYYIHEMLLVFFTGLAFAAAWRYWRSRRLGWALTSGIAIGLMQATKETFVLCLLAAAGALLLNKLAGRILASAAMPGSNRPIRKKHILAAIAAWLVVVVILFSSFFSNWQGVLDSARTYLPWMHRAGGASPHIHPWYFYAQRLLWFHSGNGPVWSEALIFVLALVGAFAAFGGWRLREGKRLFLRFLAFYTFLLAAMYCFIGYKTPWCLLGFWHGAILLAGVGAMAILDHLRKNSLCKITAAVMIAAAIQLAFQARLGSTDFASDPRNPYVYSQTSPDVLNLAGEIELLSQLHADGHQMIIEVIAPESEYWPLPWYLRQFAKVGWWDAMPAGPYPPVLIVSTRLHSNFDDRKTHVMAGIFELRPQTFFELYVAEDLWLKHVSPSQPEK